MTNFPTRAEEGGGARRWHRWRPPPLSGGGRQGRSTDRVYVGYVFYGRKRDTALKRVDSVAFMERIVVMPSMAPVTRTLMFPSWFTDLRRPAAFSGVVEEGVVPEAIGTAPSGAWPASDLPWTTLASPVRAPMPNRMSLARTRFRVCWSISSPESPSRPGNQVRAAVAKDATLMAL